MGWTPAQEQAIYTPTGDGNLLVSAAAGSGKTAVLVERILQKLIKNETTVDRLLVVTFTNAAAAEMREKIIKQLVTTVESSDTDINLVNMLKPQIRLAETADIMTIDAFCNRVVQNNFHVLGIDPNITVADTAMCELMRAEAMNNLFDRLYTTQDEEDKNRFSRLLDAYSDNRSDNGLINIINQIYEFVISFSDPEKWLDDAARNYSMPTEETPYALHLKAISKEAADTCIKNINQYLEENKELPDSLTEYANELLKKAELIAATDSLDEINEIYSTYFQSLSRKKVPDNIIQKLPIAQTDEEQIYAYRLAFIRTVFSEQLSLGAYMSCADIEDDIKNERLIEEATDITWIVKEFMHEYDNVKDSRGVCEFSDIEHLTYTLFRDNKDIREYYKNKYDEILIDEYQDTNDLQDSVFNLISHKNIFMVGDLKQSIYRFRGGDPYIFKYKRDTYSISDEENKKITLAQNFRSRQEVLRSVNDIFSSVMSRTAGDVEYAGDELIVRDKERDYYPPASFNCKSELHYIASYKNADKDVEEIRFVADKICELLSSGTMVYDKELGIRPIRKKDIVILENSVKTNGELIVRELEKRGIDAFTETESFFSRREITVMLSLLSLLNNTHRDVSLLSVMRSPIGGFSENELVRIRLYTRKCQDFITAVRIFAHSGGRACSDRIYKFKSGALNIRTKHRRSKLAYKCSRFLSDIRRWRGYVRTKTVAQLIWTLFEETYFYDIMGAIEQGEESQFNLRLLYERARQFEGAGFKGLFNFINYIENIKSRDEDLAGAKLIGENHDVVRVMTIHKSKGLEFPVVFLIGAGKKFSAGGSSATVRLHRSLGIGLPYIHYDEHYMRDTKFKEYICTLNQQELASERMRLAYVALTRAKEKLYVVVSQNVKDDFTEEANNERMDDIMFGGYMLPSVAIGASGFYDWLCPAAYANSDSWDFVYHLITDTDEDKTPEPAAPEEKSDNIGALREAVYKILDYSYPFAYSNTIPSRTSVTQLKELTIERENLYDTPVHEPDSRRVSSADDIAELMFSPLHSVPAFMREDGRKPANEIGTLYHLVMSELDPERIKAEGAICIENEIQRLAESGIISDEDIKYIDCDKIRNFYNNEIGKRLLNSKEVHREEPFQINISALDYDPSLTGEYADENVLLQGIIDCFFLEGGEYVLVDYKTDKVSSKTDIRKKYSKQLDLYKKAIEQLTGIKVKECLLYLFDTDETV